MIPDDIGVLLMIFGNIFQAIIGIFHKWSPLLVPDILYQDKMLL